MSIVVLLPERVRYADVILRSNPAGYFRLNESSGGIVDSTPFPTTGNWFGTGTPTYGLPGLISADPDTAISWDGASYVEFAAPTEFDRPTFSFSIEFWIKTTQTTLAAIWDKREDFSPFNGYLVSINNGLVNLYAKDDLSNLVSLDSTNSVADGQKHHVVLNYDRSGNGEIWIDGNLEASQSLATVTGTLGNVAIARVGFSTPAVSTVGYFNGVLDEIAFYFNGASGVLSQSTILRHYYAGNAGIP